MSAPKRIQRKHTRGWRMPEGAVYVGRPTKWGNPFTVAGYRALEAAIGIEPTQSDAAVQAEVVKAFRSVLTLGPDSAYWTTRNYRTVLAICDGLASGELRGRDLACWCPLSTPRHADVLLELANTPHPETQET